MGGPKWNGRIDRIQMGIELGREVGLGNSGDSG